MSIKDHFSNYLLTLQDQICGALEKSDGKAKFEEDRWDRPGGGGGKTRVIRNGHLYEKGGVNTSAVYGKLPASLKEQFNTDSNDFFACGISLVIHPNSPMIPTTHANFRYFEMYDDNGHQTNGWFGGGIDLTPYYFWEKDVVFFHQKLKEICDRHGDDLYPNFKAACDRYFYNAHRNEARGVGGIFFDYLKPTDKRTAEDWMNFVMDVGNCFSELYGTIVSNRKDEPFNDQQKKWQEIRRGRYVEFNLIHDRGTLFGLKTNGRTESILMSLPPKVIWEYNHIPEEGSRESELIKALEPRDWASIIPSI